MWSQAIRPHVRRGRRVSGYRRQRRSVMRMLAAKRGLNTDEFLCDECLLPANPTNPIQIAHIEPDEFSSYAARSGGTNYARWMVHVRAHPENYRLLHKSENQKEYVEKFRLPPLEVQPRYERKTKARRRKKFKRRIEVTVGGTVRR